MLLLVGCAGGTRPQPQPQPTGGGLTRLDLAVRAVSADRASVLAGVDAVQKAASSLDLTDEVCASGKGVAARTAYRAAEPLTRRARVALSALSRLVTGYRTSLRSLAQASVSVEGAARDALAAVVRDGQVEATAVERFRAEAAAVWPQYEQLGADADLWITRAVTPWYRTDQEAASAYAVLVGDTRPALEQARVRLGAAAAAVRVPSLTQSATLAAADQALAGLRGKA